MLSKDLIRRYSTYWAKLTKQDAQTIERILEFNDSPIKDDLVIKAQDPLEEVNFGIDLDRCPIYVSALLDNEFKVQLVDLLRKYKNCFA